VKQYNKNQQYKKKYSSAKADETASSVPVQKKQWMLAERVSLQALILFVFAFLLYANTLTNKYTLDDMLAITSNKYTKQGIKGISQIMSHDAFDGFFGEKKNLLAGGRYRPLAQITFAVEYQFFGLNPFVGHLNNLLLYAFLAVFLFYFLRKIFKTYKAADWYLSMPFLVTALFIAHPLHTEAVANIKGRDEIMSFFGALATLWFALKYVETKKSINLLLSAFLFIVALLSKENAITFFAVIPLTIFVFTKSNIKDHLVVLSALVFSLIIYFIIRKYALGFMVSNNVVEKELLNNPFVFATTNEKYATIIYTWFIYLKLLIFPHPLTHDYYPKQIELITFTNLKAFGALLIYAFLIWFALKNILKKNLIAFSILFFLITFSIQSNLLINIGAFMNERFMFTPLLGFCIIVAYFINFYLPKYIKDKEKLRQTTVTILIILFVGYSVKTFTRNFTWKDDFTLFTTDVNTSTNSAKCNVSAGGMWIDEANKQKDSLKKVEMLYKAIGYLNKGVSIHDKHVAGWILLGNAYMNLKDYKSSLINYENCLKVSHTHPDALTNLKALGQNCVLTKNYGLAIETYKTYLRYKPDDIDILLSLADQYPNVNRADTSIVILENLIAAGKSSYKVYNALGHIYGQYYNNLNKAIEYLGKAVELNPSDASTLENLGVAYGITGNFDQSILFFEKALKAKPDNPQVYVNMGNSYMQKKNSAKANECFAKANELKKKAALGK